MSDSTQTPPPEERPSYPPPPSDSPGSTQPMAPPPPAQAPSGIGQPADLMNRFLARLIDYVLLFVVNLILVSVVVVGAIMGSSMNTFGTGASFAASAVYAVLGALIYLGYFAFLESRNGQTVGKMALKLQTRGPGGGTPTLEEAVRRNAWTALGILGIVPIIGGLIGSLAALVAMIMIAVTINNSPTRQGWHDNFAGGTSVIKIG
jgi:uncharacterized RDD family membrane protein YckC